MTDESGTYTTDRSGRHHVVTGQPPHHEDHCTPGCPMNAATDNPRVPAGTFSIATSDNTPRTVPVTISVPDGVDVDVDVTSAQRWENADGSVFAFVTWEEWPRDAAGQEPAS